MADCTAHLRAIDHRTEKVSWFTSHRPWLSHGLCIKSPSSQPASSSYHPSALPSPLLYPIRTPRIPLSRMHLPSSPPLIPPLPAFPSAPVMSSTFNAPLSPSLPPHSCTVRATGPPFSFFPTLYMSSLSSAILSHALWLTCLGTHRPARNSFE